MEDLNGLLLAYLGCLVMTILLTLEIVYNRSYWIEASVSLSIVWLNFVGIKIWQKK